MIQAIVPDREQTVNRVTFGIPSLGLYKVKNQRVIFGVGYFSCVIAKRKIGSPAPVTYLKNLGAHQCLRPVRFEIRIIGSFNRLASYTACFYKTYNIETISS